MCVVLDVIVHSGPGELLGTHRLHSSSFLGLPYRILNANHKKEPLWSLWDPKP